jgi:hypothetical protein
MPTPTCFQQKDSRAPRPERRRLIEGFSTGSVRLQPVCARYGEPRQLVNCQITRAKPQSCEILIVFVSISIGRQPDGRAAAFAQIQIGDNKRCRVLTRFGEKRQLPR